MRTEQETVEHCWPATPKRPGDYAEIDWGFERARNETELNAGNGGEDWCG